jgi:hypothetical protein
MRQGFQDRSRGMKGSQESLTTAVVKDAANWLTPQSGDVTGSTREAVVMWANGQRPKTSDQRLRTQVAAEELKHGQAAPASSNTSGSRQGLSEPSQRNWQTFAPGTNNRGMTPHRQVVKALVSGEKAQTQMLTVDQVFAEEIKKQWATPNACDHKGATSPEACKKWEHRGQNLPEMVVAQWGTPAANDANKQNVMCEVNSKQAGLPKSVGLELQRQWATPRSGKTTDENPETWALRQAKGDVATMPLTAQVKCWGTPTARDHKSGRGNEDRQYKELTPMVERQQSGKLNPRWVETLMGLPIGWVMPSCTSPQTIAPTSCDSSATESCQPPQSELSEFSLAS